MRDIFILFLLAIVTIVRLGQPGGLRSVVAESVLIATSSSDLESWSEANSEPSVFRSHHRWFVHSLDATGPCYAVSHHLKNLHAVEFSENARETEVADAVFPKR